MALPLCVFLICLGVPLLVYFSVKLGVVAFYSGRRTFEHFKEIEDKERRDG